MLCVCVCTGLFDKDIKQIYHKSCNSSDLTTHSNGRSFFDLGAAVMTLLLEDIHKHTHACLGNV